MGLNRYIIVAETDAEAQQIGRRAWRKFYDSFILLWRRYGGTPGANLPDNFDGLMERGNAIAGSADAVLAALERQVTVAGANFLSGNFIFGDMTVEEASHSVSLFADRVMPVLADAGAQAHLELLKAA